LEILPCPPLQKEGAGALRGSDNNAVTEVKEGGEVRSKRASGVGTRIQRAAGVVRGAKLKDREESDEKESQEKKGLNNRGLLGS
jgi:hypothetical protein